MRKLFRSIVKRIPGLPSLLNQMAQRRRAKKTLDLLEKLFPLSTNRELIRFGPEGDGGYLVPNDLKEIQACFSPGVSQKSGFEMDCANLGMKVYLADASVDGPPDEHQHFSFIKKFIGKATKDEFITLEDWVTESVDDNKSELMLQMDIEGYEYEVFLNTSETLMRRFRIIVAEFHGLDEILNLQTEKNQEIFDVFEWILKTHSCVHIHPNNCCGTLERDGVEIPRVMEFTFLRNDRIEHSSFVREFPSPLDSDNTPNPPLVLPKCWYANG